MASEPQIDPESLVARIIAELQANPEAQRLLLRALLTEEFLGIPVRLERIEGDISELKADVAELKTDVAELKTDMIEVKANIGTLTTGRLTSVL
jgi:chromosome segregation ATPase